MQVPHSISNHDLCVVIPNLERALAKLHYQYLIYRRRESQTIPEEERDAAIAELRRMGIEIPDPQGQGEVQRAIVLNWQKTVGKRAKLVVPRLFELMSKARGVRENIEVLAQSDPGK